MRPLALLPGVLLVAACAKTPSNDVFTHGITADIAAQAVGDGTTTVSATLYVGDPANLDFVELAGSDQLLAEFAGDQRPMAETQLGNIVSHQTSFADDTDGDAFTVAFERTVDVSAPMSVATLPVAFTMNQPPTMAQRSSDLTLSWTSTASTDTMGWSASGACIQVASGSIAANGSALTITANTLIQEGSAASCTVTVDIQRQKLGVLDPAYGSGSVYGLQTRSFQLTSNP
jgi:hypothetical protein